MSGSAWQQSSFSLLIVTAGSGSFTGLFVYSPSPGAGNLIASVAATAGTDPYGNAYVGGVASYNHGLAENVQMFAGFLEFNTTAAGTLVTTSGNIGGRGTTAASVAPSLALESPATSSGGQAILQVVGESQDTSVPETVLISTSLTATPAAGTLLEVQGSASTTGQLLVGASTAGTSQNLEVHTRIALAVSSAPTATAGFGKFYIAADGSAHYLSPAGTDTKFGNA